MKKLSVAKSVCAASLALACAWGIVGCGGGTTVNGVKLTGGTAATVNGTEIPEDDVTLEVQAIRERMGLTDEQAWGEWMAQNGFTPETVREQVIDGLVNEELIRQITKEQEITVDAAEIDGYVDSMRSRYESDEQWQDALEQAGLTEEEYRENIELSLLSNRLMETVATDDEPAAEDMLTYAQMFASSYNGAKRSSHILFDSGDEATAQEVLEKINAGQLDFAEAAKQYSKDTGSAANGGDVGWDKLTTFVDEYQTALNDLDNGAVSGLVPSQFGIHIIKCTDVFTAPSEVTSTDQLPEEFVTSIRTMLSQSQSSQGYTTWLTEQREAADVVVNPMPEGLPYYVDMTQFETADEGADNPDTGTGTEAGTEGGTEGVTPEAPTEGDAAPEGDAADDGAAAGEGDAAKEGAADQPAEGTQGAQQ
ncbi:peptidylprolyl isomerase [Enterorhabdus sp. P55]|uniref:peptidylprolyl isomerase n=1 Tax=Enterorhabdus sp. P55 TaxID=2304571 RepID=UPI0013704E18|nr:peptidylprolyl isomerase [Enterorhabdus sp. P55]NBI31452.1 peptidylprolyl isomerase [Enterorhabdus sp. P55]